MSLDWGLDSLGNIGWLNSDLRSQKWLLDSLDNWLLNSLDNWLLDSLDNWLLDDWLLIDWLLVDWLSVRLQWGIRVSEGGSNDLGDLLVLGLGQVLGVWLVGHFFDFLGAVD